MNTTAADALAKAQGGLSALNYPTIFEGFAVKGITDIQPRVNVFTFNAWKALGRVVKKGEHGVRVLTFKNAVKKDSNGTERPYSFPSSTTVFHVSQTQELGA